MTKLQCVEMTVYYYYY